MTAVEEAAALKENKEEKKREKVLRVEGLQVALEVKLLLKRSRNSRGRGERQEISRR
jgi:hypothetical protein